jgi:hypothetical protein
MVGTSSQERLLVQNATTRFRKHDKGQTLSHSLLATQHQLVRLGNSHLSQFPMDDEKQVAARPTY